MCNMLRSNLLVISILTEILEIDGTSQDFLYFFNIYPRFCLFVLTNLIGQKKLFLVSITFDRIIKDHKKGVDIEAMSTVNSRFMKYLCM